MQTSEKDFIYGESWSISSGKKLAGGSQEIVREVISVLDVDAVHSLPLPPPRIALKFSFCRRHLGLGMERQQLRKKYRTAPSATESIRSSISLLRSGIVL